MDSIPLLAAAAPLPSSPTHQTRDSKPAAAPASPHLKLAMSCCPPGSAGFLSSDGNHVGSKITHGTTDLYVTGPASAACGVVLVPDIWGWDSGRTRNIADALAANGWAVVRAPFTHPPPPALHSTPLTPPQVVPKLLTPVYPGGDGTDGDGMAPNQQPGDDFPGFCAWLAQFPPEVKHSRGDDGCADARHAGASAQDGGCFRRAARERRGQGRHVGCLLGRVGLRPYRSRRGAVANTDVCVRRTPFHRP